MQLMFSEDTPWHVPWMSGISPAVVEVASRYPDKTIFTRFVPPISADAATGMWKDYYRKWEVMTLGHMDRRFVDVVPELAQYVPPARTFDKATYSPWIDGRLHMALQNEGVRSVVITGGETDVCVLAAVMGAIDLGYAVKLLRDAVCSGTDETHEATLQLLADRFSVQVEVLTTETFLRRQ
jgi:nicotinamidase-related amidase